MMGERVWGEQVGKLPNGFSCESASWQPLPQVTGTILTFNADWTRVKIIMQVIN